jgi:excisionase family DNA binding protein
MSIEKSFCTTREAATILGVSVGTVQLWVESGILQAWKTTGGHRRVMRESVDRLLRRVPVERLLRRVSDQPSAQTPVTTPQNIPRQLHVMVVEDDPHLLRLYQIKFSYWPTKPNIICVDSAVTALLMIGRGGIDLLITDLHMPQMDGFSMLHQLHKAPEMINTTIVVVTGIDQKEIESRGGIPTDIEVLAKPVNFGRLLIIATSIVNSSRFLMEL